MQVGARVADVALGSRSSCALLEDGSVRCWGNGQPSAADAKTLELPGRVVQISAGTLHFCAPLEDGGVVCWGEGGAGQLGYGDLSPLCGFCDAHPSCCVGDDETPEQRGAIRVGGAAVDVSAGDLHSCAVIEGGQVRCWGSDEYGALGLRRIDVIGDDEAPGDIEPVDVGGPAVRVVADHQRTCARLEDGTVRCWGRTERWDGTTDWDCMVDVPNPSAGTICEPPTIPEFSCEPAPNCCLGDVNLPDRQPYVVAHKEILPMIRLAQTQPGATFNVAVDPNDPAVMALLWA